MVKQLLLISLVIGCALASTIRFRDDEFKNHMEDSMNVSSMIWSHGYRSEEHTVKTKDGYLLTLIRVKPNINTAFQSRVYLNSLERSSEEESHESQKSETIEDYSNKNIDGSQRRPPVLLMPGLVSNAEDFIIGGPSQALAYMLVDRGYDVFLANLRGSTYGLKHTTLDPARDSAFWRYGIDEMSTKDVTAIIDEVLKITEHEKLTYIGHMEGSTVFYVMASEKPEYNDKIASLISLGPVAFMKHSTNMLLKKISQHLDHPGWTIQNLGQHKFNPSNEVLIDSEQDCLRYSTSEMCVNPYFLLKGYSSRNINMTTLERLVERTPEWVSSSTRQILNYAIFVRTGRFAKVVESEEQVDIEDYDLRKVTVPVSIFSTPRDAMSADEDVQKLIEKLPNVNKVVRMHQYTNNLDLLHGKNVGEEVGLKVIHILKKIMY